jgi:hypothetical protein
MCADECGVVWPYVPVKRTELMWRQLLKRCVLFAVVVEERSDDDVASRQAISEATDYI